MPRRATGNAFWSKGAWYARVTLRTRPRVRRAFQLPTVRDAHDEDAAHARAAVLAEIAAQLQAAGQSDHAARIVEAAAGAREGAELREVVDLVRRICDGELRPKPTSATTFRELGELWTSGKLAERWPDHVKVKRTAHRDAALLRTRIYPLVGDTRLVDFTLDDAERVIASLPPMEQATRRQHAQALARVLALAAYPARIIPRSPLPRGFVPPQRSTKAKGYLFPVEDRALLGCRDVPLECRMLYGVLAREGMREGEGRAMTWSDLMLDVGMVRLDENKTDDPRAWALDPGVARALRAWYAMRGKPAGDVLVFDGEGFDWQHVAARFRAHLRLAGVDRAELFEATRSRLRVRVHDLRGTFVTLSLANGRTETWVADRTGHKSSMMINTYRRQARTAAELGLGELAPMDEAIPEIREWAAERAAEQLDDDRDSAQAVGKIQESRTGGMAYAGDLKAPEVAVDGGAHVENAEKTQGAASDERRTASPAAHSEAPAAHSATPRADAIDALSTHIARCSRAGDTATAHILERTLRELLAVRDDGPDAEVIDLGAHRRRS